MSGNGWWIGQEFRVVWCSCERFLGSPQDQVGKWYGEEGE